MAGELSIGNLRAFLQTMGQGLRDRIRPEEELSITMQPARQIICFHCGRLSGYVKDAARPAALANMAPLAGGPQPGWICPQCHKDIRVWLPQGAAIKTNKGVLPC